MILGRRARMAIADCRDSMSRAERWLWPALLAIVILGYSIAMTSLAFATWKPEYAQLPQEVRDWYANAELTRAAQERFSFQKCCAQSEVVKTKFRVSKSAGANDEWWWLDGATWKKIPDDIIHWGETAPGGEPTLFVYAGQETCFWPADGGI